MESIFLFFHTGFMSIETPSEQAQHIADCEQALPLLAEYYPAVRERLSLFLRQHVLRPSQQTPQALPALLQAVREAGEGDAETKRLLHATVGYLAADFRSAIERLLLPPGGIHELYECNLQTNKGGDVAHLRAHYSDLTPDIDQYWARHAVLQEAPSAGTYAVIELRHQDATEWRDVLAQRNLKAAGLRELTAFIRHLGGQLQDQALPFSRTDYKPWHLLANMAIAAPGDTLLDRCCAAKVTPRWSGFTKGQPQKEVLETIPADALHTAILIRKS